MALAGEVQRAMRACIPTGDSSVTDFYGMIEYHLGWRDPQLQPAVADPGKLLRPQMLILACAICGGQRDHALTAAAAVQLLHDFTLLHDDIQDVSATRRNRLTVWRLWGSAQAINAGDSLATLARLSLARLADQGLPAGLVIAAITTLDKTTLTIIEGQYLDLAGEGDLGLSVERYLEMIRRKTAVLFGTSAGLGALIAGAPAQLVDAWSRLGEALGMAFQIQDDILGIWGDPEHTGKPRAADLARHKMTLPVIHALNGTAGATLRHHYEQRVVDVPLEPLVAVLDACDARRVADQALLAWRQRAEAALTDIEVSLPGCDLTPVNELVARMLPLSTAFAVIVPRQSERSIGP